MTLPEVVAATGEVAGLSTDGSGRKADRLYLSGRGRGGVADGVDDCVAVFGLAGRGEVAGRAGIVESSLEPMLVCKEMLTVLGRLVIEELAAYLERERSRAWILGTAGEDPVRCARTCCHCVGGLRAVGVVVNA